MEVTEVEVHRRPRDVEDDDDVTGVDDSSPTGIGSGQVSHRDPSVNPLAPKTPSPSAQRDDSNGIGSHENPLPVTDEELPRHPQRNPASTSNQCEIEIEPGTFTFTQSFGILLDHRR
ncbi:unnamed protein product [Strongylus vulgaris]|uniref:Uncharacterized protein n=1 Tax=Strongylus vulgaris TaxID=40348 RepID=A0A3P7J643_STRVU|nr:unnamed protein product [Strongylus vulgaris]